MPDNSPKTAPTALITGITGQDGYYLARLLHDKGYRIHGIVRNLDRCPDFPFHVELHQADLGADTGWDDILHSVHPDEVYNLASQSHVGTSFNSPIETANISGLGPLRLMEAARRFQTESGKRVRFLQASSCEMFAGSDRPLNEQSPIAPPSPYGCAKAFAHWQLQCFRANHNLFACSAILFNHESPRRPPHFVTRKITAAAARIKLGRQTHLELGNLDVARDWGFAGDFVDAMWRMLQQEQPADYVVATGETHTLRELLQIAFNHVGLDWKEHVLTTSAHSRPTDITVRWGDPARARDDLGWKPTTPFARLVQIMVDHDLLLAEQEH